MAIDKEFYEEVLLAASNKDAPNVVSLLSRLNLKELNEVAYSIDFLMNLLIAMGKNLGKER